MARYFLFLFSAASIFFISCSTNNVATVLSNQPILKDIGADSIGSVVGGEAVKYLNEISPDSAMVKIKAAGGEGWVPRYSVATAGSPAVVIRQARIYHNQDSSSAFIPVTPGIVIVVDTTSSPWCKATYVYEGRQQTSWITKRNISTNMKDILFVVNTERFIQSSGSMPAEQRVEAYSKFLADNADSKMATVIPVNLSEATDDAIKKINSFDAFADKAGNRVITGYSNADNRVISFIKELYENKDYNDEIDPRFAYFTRFVSQLPTFVKIGPRYEFADNFGLDQSIKSFVFFRVDRSPENIKKLYDRFRSPILAALSQVDAETTSFTLERLIGVHDYIVALPNYQATCKKISQQVAQRDKRTEKFVFEIVEQAEFYEPILDQKIMQYYQGPDQQNEGIWYHSFWVRRFAEGNADVVYTILLDLAKENRNFLAPLENTMDDEYDADPGEVQELTCVLTGAGLGDCAHINFTCGDFGYADISRLNEEQSALWRELTVPAEADDIAANPEYLGKTFRILMREVQGEACNEGQGGMGLTQQIISIELVK